MDNDSRDDESGTGAAYLAALKGSTAPQAASAAPARAPSPAAPAAPSAPSAGTGPASSERRKSPRYRCQGSVHLREINGGSATWAAFTDISLHGCYVEVATSYSVGAALALTIDVNGFRIEATGEVRVAYPGLGMGISFTKLTDKDREQLRALMRSISQPSVIMSAPSSPSIHRADALPAAANPAAVLQTIQKFFESRHVMGREEFLAILRKNQ